MVYDYSFQRTGRCDICNVACTSASSIFDHVTGRRHRSKARRALPALFPSTSTLQSIFDNYIKLEPLVGLECIEQRRNDKTYSYHCHLCAFQGGKKSAFQHIIGLDHIAKYLKTYHPKLPLGSCKYEKALQQAASDVCRRFGRKQMKITDDPQTMVNSSSDPKTESNVTPDINRDSNTSSLKHLERKGSDHPAASGVCKRFGRKNVKKSNGLPQKMAKSDPKTKSKVTPYINRNVRTSSLQNLQRKGSDHPAASGVCKKFGSKNVKESNSLPQKMAKSEPKTKSNVTPDINRNVRTSSLQHQERKGSNHPAASDVSRKRIIEVNADGSHGPTPPKMSKSSNLETERNVTPDIIRDVHMSSLQNLKEKSSDHPPALDACERVSRKTIEEIDGLLQKMLKSDSDPKTENSVAPDINRDVHTRSLQNLEQRGSDHPAEVLVFTGNGEFLDFLQKFEIRSEADAWFVEKIIQNCAQELERFQEEQTQQNQVPGAPPAPANGISKGSSASAMGAGKVAPAPELQTNATSSIKNMEGSEVGTILQEMEKLLQLTRPSE